jgi:dTDP-4-amino-4,6-dideoxygalactose transaminase
MGPIMEIADRFGLYVIEDAAQAHGAEYEGKRIGSIGHASCFSFYPGKNLGAYGDGGAVVTNSGYLAERIRRLRDHGRISKYEHAEVGFNSRLDALQAAVLGVKLRYLDGWNSMRRQVADWYTDALRYSDVETPFVRTNSVHVYHLYVIQSDDRDSLRDIFESAGIGIGIHYPLILPLQPALSHLGYREGDFPRSEEIAKRLLSLPMFPELRQDQVARVVQAISSARIKSPDLAVL